MDKQLEGMMIKHQQDRIELEEEEQKFLQELHQEQQEKLQAKKEANEEQVSKQMEEHQQQLEELAQNLEENLPQQPKMSSEYLNLKKIEENMVKQKKFGEAHQIQQQAIQLEKEELQKHLQWRQKKIVTEQQKLMQQQNVVIASMRKKFEAQEFEEYRSFEEEMRTAQARYQNMKNDVQNHQNKEVAKMQTMIKNGGTMLNSSMGSTMFQSKAVRGSPASKRKRASKLQQPGGAEEGPENEEDQLVEGQ